MTLGAEFFTLTTLYLLALLSPGQDFFLILRHALLHGHRSAWWSCLGIALGNGFYIALSFLGHGILGQISWLLPLIESGGALFLIYLGGLLLLSPKPHFNTQEEAPHRPSLASGFFWQGLLSALLNPKNTLFYLSVLFTILPPEITPATRLFYGAWMISLLLFWDMGLAYLLGHPSTAARLLPFLHPIQKIVGIALILFGLISLGRGLIPEGLSLFAEENVPLFDAYPSIG
ncbi:LysE family translocator [Wolinella succinogenes]|uniref:LysE family translocator n=1 Tax=Wolinella succinogenes TaxID=844 RepID=UPI00240A182E|nr:LysE family transporter [Wolinella succinogenes]